MKKRRTLHPVCKMLPRMSAEGFAQLKDDIAKNGLLEPIWTKNNQVIDGRHRLMACYELKIKPQFREYEGPLDVETFVYSLNLARRQMTRHERTWFIKRLLKTHPEKSTRAIAEIAGTNESTVRRVRNTAASNDAPRAPRVGRDGKTYSVPNQRNPASLITHIDFESRKCLRFLLDLDPRRLTDPADFIFQLEYQLARLKALVEDVSQTG